MEIDYKRQNVSKRVKLKELGDFNYTKNYQEFTKSLRDTSLYQMNLNIAMNDFTNFYENHNESGIINVFDAIIKNFPDEKFKETDFRNGVIDIFKYFGFHQKVIDLLQYNEWKTNSYAIYILLILINCEDEEILNYLINNNLIEVINFCIVANNDTSYIALLCLGNILNATGNKYQKLICDIINFEDIEQYFHKENEILFCSLFLLRNVIHFFQYIPDPEKFTNLLISLISPQRIQEFIISTVSSCLIEMIRIDPTVLKIIYNDPLIFSKFYQIYIYEKGYISLQTKKEVLLLFVTISRTLNSLCNKNPESREVFYEMKNILFDQTFNSYESLAVAIDLDDDKDSNCIKMVLELLSNSILINADFQKNIKAVYNIIQYTMHSIYEIFKLKKVSINLLLSFIEVFSDNQEILRYLREIDISTVLIDFLSYDGNIHFCILNSILIIVRAFQSTIESEMVKQEFISEDLNKALDELPDDNEELKALIKLVKKEVYDEEEE